MLGSPIICFGGIHKLRLQDLASFDHLPPSSSAEIRGKDLEDGQKILQKYLASLQVNSFDQ